LPTAQFDSLKNALLEAHEGEPLHKP
jgi:hypothetical protein